MGKRASNTVREALVGAGARPLDDCTLNGDISLALWCNRDVQVDYQRVGHHTLSLYLRGGHKTRRLDKGDGGFGGPGKLCLMPAAQDSRWDVGGYQEFFHLYISDAGLKHFALESFGLDPRRVELPDLTFFEHPQINAACAQLLQSSRYGGWQERVERLAIQQAAQAVMTQLLQSYVVARTGGTGKASLRGGLSRGQLNRVREYIDAQLAADIGLEDLAEAAGLSRFHFARMFKLSTGLTPQQYLNKMRVQRGLELLRDGVPQAEAAALCGFAHQSHFAAHFKRIYGLPPGQYLRSV